MSDLLINVEMNLLSVVWALAFIFILSSLLICAWLSLRRIARNRQQDIRLSQKQAFEAYISDVVKTPSPPGQSMKYRQDCSIDVIAAVLLHYFRTVRGAAYDHLQACICEIGLETQIIQATEIGVRGRRMRALSVLAYLGSENSRRVLFESLNSSDRYVRLTAARGLVKRKSLEYLSDIIRALHSGFPQDHQLVATIISPFGIEASKPLEAIVVSAPNNEIKAICLEALNIIMPPQTDLDMAALMQNPEASVRAAALSFSTVSDDNKSMDLLALGLKDVETEVKIRAAKLTGTLRRADLVSDLYALSDDPVLWVRYWAIRAIWESGQSGKIFVETLEDTNPMAKNIRREMSEAHV